MSFRSKGGSFGALVLEVVLITLGVFLALMASNWNESRQHRALADSTLGNFVDEIRENQGKVQAERQYHETLSAELKQFLRGAAPHTEESFAATVHFTGVHPINFEHTAWDLALATQALAYLKPETALAISRVYTAQSSFQTLENNFLGVSYTIFTNPDATVPASALTLYLGDVNAQEPKLLELYSKTLAEIEAGTEGGK